MEDWKIRLVEEYKELSAKIDKLADSLNDEEFCSKVGQVQYFYMVTQYTGMRVYLEALVDRLDDLEIKID